MMSYEVIAEHSKNLARKYVSEGNFGRAFSHYLVALKLNPSWREEFKEEFSTVLCRWGTTLDEKRKFDDLFKCYEQAVEIYPDSVVILNNLGAHLLRCGLLREAAHYFRKCVDIDRHFIRAGHNLESVANSAVERWHFRMLNDKHRNEAFREAIVKKIRQGYRRVLDVGTGTGLLSLFCVEGKAEEIYACESSPVMSQIAEQVFLSNNATDVHLVPKHSTTLNIPEDIPQRLSLLVTETFDSALLGEHILHTLSHAWQHLLSPPTSALVLPFAATLYATALQFDPLANDLHLTPNSNSPLLHRWNLFRNTDNYDTHDLSRTPFKPLTPTETIFQLDFNDPASLAEALAGHRKQIRMQSTASGRLDCIAVWFDLHLDEDIVLNTGPHSKDNAAWDQAVFPLRRSILVQRQQEIVVEVQIQNGGLGVSVADDSGPGIELSDGAVKMLGDDGLGRTLEELGRRLGPGLGESVSVLDCFPFPVFGLKLLSGRGGRSGDKLSCVVGSEGDGELVRRVGEEQGFEVEVLVGREIESGGWLEGRKFDVILLDVVESSGELKDGLLLELDYLKSLLKPEGILLPQQATVVAQFLHSEWLTRASKVIDNSVTCDYHIAVYMNVYQVRRFIDLDLKSTEKTVCTGPFDLFSVFDHSESVEEKTVAVSPAGPVHANALAYWLRIKFTEGCEITTNEGTFYHQSAILFPKTEFFENIKFDLVRNSGLFNIELLS